MNGKDNTPRDPEWSQEFRQKTAGITDKVQRVAIYFIKENHDHEMYDKHRHDIDAMVAYVEPILSELMEFLDIDPKAKSY